jgi:hypothetical protein
MAGFFVWNEGMGMSLDFDLWAFIRRWENEWNSHNVEAVLAHFHENVVFTSPLAEKVLPGSAGAVKGKAALRRYWNAALLLNPDLAFEVTAAFSGVDCLLIAFRNERGEDRVEILRFQDRLVIEGHGTYGLSAIPSALFNS